MELADVFSLREFNDMMTAHLDREAPYGTQGRVYNELFRWIYGEDPGFAIDRRAVLAKWLNGTRQVNAKVMNVMLENLELSRRQYSQAFQFLIDEGTFTSAGNLTEELEARLQSDAILQKRGINYENMDCCEVMAEAFLCVLLNDYVQDHITIRADVEASLHWMLANCEAAGQTFRTPHALYALMVKENSLLFKALECVQAGFGSHCLKQISLFINTHQKMGATVSLDDLLFIFNSKKAAFYENKRTADEMIVTEWVLACKSNTVNSLNTAVQKHGKTLADMLAAASKNQYTTTWFEI